jgi:hypothetical protein
MYEEFDKQEFELKLLLAKDAVFRLVSECLGVIKINSEDPNLYFYDYCESTWERAFNTLEIEEDAIEEFEFYKLWEENNKKIWVAYDNTDEMPETWGAQWMYNNLGSGDEDEEFEVYEDEDT